MRPVLLQGHQRSLTQIKYNSDGDLLFSVSKDNTPCVWYSHNGEMLGTYKGHGGTVWSIDVSYDSKLLVTGSADNSARLWEVETGKPLFVFETKTAVRSVALAQGDLQLAFVTDQVMGQPSLLHIFDIEKDDISQQTSTPRLIVNIKENCKAKATVCVWTNLNEHIITGHDDGEIAMWDPKSGEKIQSVKNHGGSITSIQFSNDRTYFITSSKDHSAKIFDSRTLDVKKVYQTERPVNSAAISNLKEHVILGGGQEASQVTTTSSRVGKFEVRFFHRILEQEIGRVKGHFGPINTVAFHPDGKSFASGGEDGYVRLHHFDPDYFEFEA